MRILVVPRYAVTKICKQREKENRNSGTFYITIYSSGDCAPRLACVSGRILPLQFDDITKAEHDHDIRLNHLKLFTEDHANTIKEFINGTPMHDTLIVSCDAGVSRSGAIGDCLNVYCNKYMEDIPEHYELFAKDNPYIHPNPYVKMLMNRVLYDYGVQK